MYRIKPNVAHLREFGAPVWVLLQGQNIACKILPKLIRRAYVGYNNDFKSVIYYNADTRRCLTSRNYKFLTALKLDPSEEIEINDDPIREGEWEEEKKENAQTDHEPGPKKKRKISETLEMSEEAKDEPRRTRGVCIDYCHLNDPFPKEDEIDADDPEANILFALTAKTKDEFCSIKQACESPEWPDWEKGIVAKLNQL